MLVGKNVDFGKEAEEDSNHRECSHAAWAYDFRDVAGLKEGVRSETKCCPFPFSALKHIVARS
jgi:hypothetical protein